MLAIDFLNLPELAATAGGNGWLMDLNYCLQALDGIAKRRAMEVVSSGDAYVALTGVVGPSRFSRAEALAAAMEIRDVAYRLAAQRRAEGRPHLMVRIAVHSGPVVAGVAEARRFTFSVWGFTKADAVAVAQQLDPWEVAFSEGVWAGAAGDNAVPNEVKNLQRPSRSAIAVLRSVRSVTTATRGKRTCSGPSFVELWSGLFRRRTRGQFVFSRRRHGRFRCDAQRSCTARATLPAACTWF